MAIFNNMRITDKGKILYAKAQAGHELHFTKMRVGAGNVDSRNPDTLLDLIDPKYDVGIQSISPNSETKSATISGMINNGAVKEPTYICEIGLYAEDPDEGEILYGYASAGQYGDYYAPNTVGAFTWNYQVVAAIGNAANVTIELSSLVYDYGVINTTPSFIHLSGGNQKEINKSIDNTFTTIFNSGDYIYYCEASGSVNSYRVTIDEYTKKAYTKGMGIAVLINANSTGASTININGIGAVGIKKANGNNVTNLKAGSIYTMRYNGTNFILQGEGASGNAKSSDLLSGKTAESDNGELVGTIPIKGAQTYTPSASDQVIKAGQYIGENQIIKGDSNLKPENILNRKIIFGITGKLKTGVPSLIELLQKYRFYNICLSDYIGEETYKNENEFTVFFGNHKVLVYTKCDKTRGGTIYLTDTRVVFPKSLAFVYVPYTYHSGGSSHSDGLSSDRAYMYIPDSNYCIQMDGISEDYEQRYMNVQENNLFKEGSYEFKVSWENQGSLCTQLNRRYGNIAVIFDESIPDN